MNIAEIKEALAESPLYVVERQTSRRGIPNIVSFYLVVWKDKLTHSDDIDYELVNIDAELVKVIGEGAKLIKVGRVLAASIHDPYMHTLEEHMEDLSTVLFGDPKRLAWRVI